MKQIIIVNSNSMNSDNATGVTLRSIFGQISPEYLLEIYWNPTQFAKDKLMIHSIKLHFSPFSIGTLFANQRGHQISFKIKENFSFKLDNKNFAKILITHIRQLVALLPDLSKIQLNRQIMNEIKSFNPEIIYTIGGGVASLKIAYELSCKLNIPIVIHFMDNWIHCIQWEDNPFLKFYKRSLRRYARLCYNRTTACLAISPRMAEVYTAETGIQHFALMNSIRVEDYICLPREEDSYFYFVYAGGLHLGRYRSLYQIGFMIDKLLEKTEKKLRLIIYTSLSNIQFYQNKFEDLQSVILRPAVPHSEMKRVYESSDVLVHVETSSIRNNDFFKYSISTKIPEYLATGKTILFYGPSDIYLYEFLSDNKIAITAFDEESLWQSLIRIISGEAISIYAQNAIAFAREHFDISTTINTIYEIMEEANSSKENR